MNPDRRKFLTAMSAITGVGALGTYNAGRAAAAPGGPPIRIGAPLSATGPYASDGQDTKIAIDMAIDDINSLGGLLGRKLEVVTYDIGDLSPDKVKAGFTYLTSAGKADFLITQTMFSPGPDVEVAASSEVPYMHFSCVHDFSDLAKNHPDKYWMTFMGCPWEYVHGEGLVSALEVFQRGGWKPRDRSIAMIATNSSYSAAIEKTMRESIAKHGWKITLHETIVTPFTQWGAILSKIQQANPDFIFNADYIVGDLAAFQNQFMQNPTKSLVYQQFAPANPEYTELTKDNSTGVLYGVVIGILGDEIGKEFRERFRKRSGQEPGGTTPGAIYDGVWMFAKAVLMANGPEDRRKVCRFIREGIHRGVCGSYTFRPGYQDVPAYPEMTGDPTLGLPHQWIQIWDGKRNAVAPDIYATAPFRVPPWMT